MGTAKNLVRRCAFGVVLCIAMSAAACLDPEKATMALFSKQGLTLLKPARDYIVVGGLVTVKGGAPRYDDPFDPLPTAATVPFNAVIAEEAKKDTAKFGISLSQLGGLVKLPVGLKADSTIDIELAQASTRGTRLKSGDLLKYLELANTGLQAKESLKSGARVFVVQDVYTGKSLSVKTLRSGGFQATLGSGEAVSSCTPAKPTAETKKEPPKSDGAADSKAAVAGNKSPVIPAVQESKPAAESKPAGAAQGSDNTAPTMSASVCREGSFALKFSSDADIPFAVRLVEIALNTEGKLFLKPGKPNVGGALGSDPGTPLGFIDPTNPVITQLQHTRRLK